jgi:hypothetical protein
VRAIGKLCDCKLRRPPSHTHTVFVLPLQYRNEMTPAKARNQSILLLQAGSLSICHQLPTSEVFWRPSHHHEKMEQQKTWRQTRDA